MPSNLLVILEVPLEFPSSHRIRDADDKFEDCLILSVIPVKGLRLLLKISFLNVFLL